MSDDLRYRIGVSTIQATRARYGSLKHLWEAEVQVYSQWGEDGILDFLCSQVGVTRPRAIEYGAGNFRECNTRFLAEFRHGSVVAVDARDDLIASARALPLYWQTEIHPIRSWITPDSAPDLLTEARSIMGGVDLVSMDIDGNDYWVVQSLPLEGVRIVVVEYNAVFGPDRAVTVPRDDTFARSRAHYSHLYYGASLRAWVELLGERGFVFLGTNLFCSNAFFCRAEDASRLAISVPDLEDLSLFMDCRVRESRDIHGELDYLDVRERSELIQDLPLVDVSGEVTPLVHCPG